MEVNDLHSFLHFVQFPELDALRKVRDSNPRNSIRVIRFTFNIEKISIRFPRHFLGITIPSLQHSNYKSIVIDLIVFCQRPKFVCHIFGTVLSQKFGLFSPHQQPPDKGGYFFVVYSYSENFFVLRKFLRFSNFLSDFVIMLHELGD